jgi:hypothetical protein
MIILSMWVMVEVMRLMALMADGRGFLDGLWWTG